MNENLRFGFDDDGDGTGKLSAEIIVEGFRARGAAWFSINELKALASALRAFPLPIEPRLKIAGGFYSRSEPAKLETVLLAIQFYPVGVRGQLGARVHVETEVWPDDRMESRNEATVELLTTYAHIDRFSRELEALVSGRKSEALLPGERLA